MTFEEEWAQHKADASGRQGSARMHLNQADSPGGDSAPAGDGVASTAADKKKAAKYLEEDLLPDVVKAGKHAGGSTQSVTGTAPAGRADPAVFGGPGELDEWEIKVGLHHAMKHWGQQVNNVLARLNGEMGALREATGLYTSNDVDICSRLKDLIPPGEPGSGVAKGTLSMIAPPDPLETGAGGATGPPLANPQDPRE